MSDTAMTFVRNLGNHPYTLCVWVTIGLISSFLAPNYWMGGENFHIFPGITGVLIALILYVAGYRWVRPHHLARKRDRGWRENFGGNSALTILTVLVVLARHDKLCRSEIWSQVFVALAVFSLMEILRLSFDYGLMQFFLRLPLQCSVLLLVKGDRSWVLPIVTLILYLGCSLWGYYYVSVYDDGLRGGGLFAQRAEDGLRGRGLLPERADDHRVVADSGSGTRAFGMDISRNLAAVSEDRAALIPKDSVIETGGQGRFVGAAPLAETNWLVEHGVGQRGG